MKIVLVFVSTPDEKKPPRVFGSGDSIVIKEKMDVKLQLLSS